ncbi:MAG TPA: SCO family protein [Pirellulales bacterium]|nr:SCO family protein [Pirellulales bacterium]
MSCLVLAFGAAGDARAQTGTPLPPQAAGVRIDQRLDAQVPVDLVFRDETGKSVRLEDEFQGKPTILVLAQFRCPRLCTQILNGLLDCLEAIPSLSVGDQFNVLTVSFDPAETPLQAARKKEPYLGSYGRPRAAEGWHFLTGDKASIAALTEAVGFHFTYDPKTDQFAHASAIMILTPQGKVSRYFYGIDYAPTEVRLGLVEAANNKIGSLTDQFLLLCFHYDPTTGKYGFAILNLVRVAGVLTLAAFGVFFVRMWRHDRKTTAAAAPAANDPQRTTTL